MAKHPRYNIIIPVGMKPRPKIHEETAADILAKHFKSDVYFIETGSQGTPDVSVKGIEWKLRARLVLVRIMYRRICVKQLLSQEI